MPRHRNMFKRGKVRCYLRLLGRLFLMDRGFIPPGNSSFARSRRPRFPRRRCPMTRYLSIVHHSLAFTAIMGQVSLAAAQGAPAYAGGPVTLPFTTGARGHVFVEVVVNGDRRVPFVLDTGAGRTVLNQARLDSLGVVQRASTDSLQGAHASFAMGVTEVESLVLGGIALGALELGTMDLAGFEASGMPVFGVLGYDVLSRFDVLLDFGQETIALHPRAGSVDACAVCAGPMTVPFSLAQGTIIRFEVTINGQPIAALLDTGSGRSAMNHLAAKAIGVELPPKPPGGHGPALQVDAVEVGGEVLVRNLIVGVVDLPVFTAVGVADGPTMLVGTGALVGRRVGISYGTGRLSFK